MSTDFTVFSYVFFACISSLRRQRHETRERLDTEGICYTCKYDLSGTPATLPCPECGSTAREHYRAHASTSLHVHWQRLGWSVLMGMLLVAYLVSAGPIAEAVVVSSYEVMGYSPEVALKAARARELRGDPTSILWPVSAMIASAPLIGFGSDRRRRLAALGILLMLAFAVLAYEWYFRFML
jgi:hypothetical protein